MRSWCCGLVWLGLLADAGGRTALAQSSPQGKAAVEETGALSQDPPSFEVASVRHVPEHEGLPPFAASPRPPFARSSGRFDATATLRDVIRWAFGLQVPMEGSFRELDDVFVIAAKAAGPVLLVRRGEVGPMNQMMQSLLAERFKLRVRWETRSFPVYALRRTTTDQLGRNLKRIEADCPAGYPETVNAAPVGCAVRLSFGEGRLKGVVPRIADFANFLASFAGTIRPVLSTWC